MTEPSVHVLALEVQDASRSIEVPTTRSLKAWCRAALRKDCTVTMRIVGKREGAALNEQFRGKDYPTNVLTFVYENRPACIGDIVLCAPVVRAEARQQGKALRAHWAHLVVHGMLHLQGFDHDTPGQARRMERLEKQILSELGYPDPYVVAA